MTPEEEKAIRAELDELRLMDERKEAELQVEQAFGTMASAIIDVMENLGWRFVGK